MLGAVMFGHRGFQPVIDAIIELAEVAAKEPRDFTAPDYSDARSRDARRSSRPICATPTRSPTSRTATPPSTPPRPRSRQPSSAEGDERRSGRPSRSPTVFKDLQAKIVRWNILDTGTRIDGRDLKTVRPIVSEVGILPRTHGSALFTRGETQALVVATLGTGEDEQYVDALTGTYKENVPAALQLPALLGRRDRPHGFARPPRNRPRQARLARHPPDAAGCRTVPLHDARRLGDHRVRTARPRWRPSAAPRWR